MATVPSACPACKGSGAVLRLAGRDKVTGPVPHPFWYLYDGYGFVSDPCLLCWGRGTLEPEPLPDMDPGLWPHRVPQDVFSDA